MYKIKEIDDDGNFIREDYKLLIIDDFKNPEEIDLNESNINTIPAKILYYYRDKIINKEDNIILKNNLNNWINSPVDYNNPLSPIMNEHLNTNNKKNINIFIKLSEYFCDEIHRPPGFWSPILVVGSFPSSQCNSDDFGAFIAGGAE